MKTLKQQLTDNRARKAARKAAFKKPEQQSRSPFLNLMIMPNEQIQGLILQGTSSTFVPSPKGDHRPFAALTRARKAATRNAAWNGVRA